MDNRKQHTGHCWDRSRTVVLPAANIDCLHLDQESSSSPSPGDSHVVPGQEKSVVATESRMSPLGTSYQSQQGATNSRLVSSSNFTDMLSEILQEIKSLKMQVSSIDSLVKSTLGSPLTINYICPIINCTSKSISRSAFIDHLRWAHGYSHDEYRHAEFILDQLDSTSHRWKNEVAQSMGKIRFIKEKSTYSLEDSSSQTNGGGSNRTDSSAASSDAGILQRKIESLVNDYKQQLKMAAHVDGLLIGRKADVDQNQSLLKHGNMYRESVISRDTYHSAKESKIEDMEQNIYPKQKTMNPFEASELRSETFENFTEVQRPMKNFKETSYRENTPESRSYTGSELHKKAYYDEARNIDIQTLQSGKQMARKNKNQWQIADEEEKKPSYTYSTLIRQAIQSSEEQALTLSEIYGWISTNYPFYSMNKINWKNAVRHNLSLYNYFVRIKNPWTKGSSKWTVNEEHYKECVSRKRNWLETGFGDRSECELKVQLPRALSQSINNPEVDDNKNEEQEVSPLKIVCKNEAGEKKPLLMDKPLSDKESSDIEPLSSAISNDQLKTA